MIEQRVKNIRHVVKLILKIQAVKYKNPVTNKTLLGFWWIAPTICSNLKNDSWANTAEVD